MARRRKNGSRSLLGILLCIPLAFIVYFAISFSSHNISPDSVVSVGVTLPDGQQYLYTDNEQVSFFVNALLDSKSISSPVRDISGETPVTLFYDRGDKTLTYKLYPQLNLSGCMLVDTNGSYFLLTSDTAKNMLVRHELQYLYADRLLPVLSIVSDAGTITVAPAEYNWLYKKIDGNYYPDRITETFDNASDTVNSIFPDTGSTLVFSVEPSEFSISFTTERGDAHTISDLSFLNFSDDTGIVMTVTAKWSELGGADFYGEATYTFPLIYDIPAVVSLEQNVFAPGDFAVLSLKYLNNNEKITLNTQLATSDIICYSQGDTSFALLPISVNNSPGEYTINFSVGGTSYSDTVTITQMDFERSLLSVTEEDYHQMLSPEVLFQTGEMLSAVFGQTSEEAYYKFGDVFTPPLKGTVYAKYGKEFILSQDAAMYRVPGTVFTVASGTAVKAAQRGRVVFAEAITATGNTVIIDHGFGVMSCYFNLKNFDCKAGDIVQQGEIIAYSGSTGFTSGLSVLHYAVAVNGVFVNPNIFYSQMTLPDAA